MVRRQWSVVAIPARISAYDAHSNTRKSVVRGYVEGLPIRPMGCNTLPYTGVRPARQGRENQSQGDVCGHRR